MNRDYLGIFSICAVAICAATVALSAPEQIAAPKPKQSAIPVLPTGQTNWGELTQDGRNLTITHRDWTATGLVLDNGRIVIVWNR